jgi:hypothetical protein
VSDWYPGNPDIDPPVYTTVPTIEVTDGASMQAARRHLWERSRDEGLALWTPLTFEVVEADLPAGYPFVLDGIGLDLYTLPEGVNGMGDYVPPPTLNQDAFGAGYAVFSKRRFGAMWELHETELNHRYAHRWMRALIAHEVGHALGFAHGGTGVMAGGWRPNEEEIQAVKDYYGV